MNGSPTDIPSESGTVHAAYRKNSKRRNPDTYTVNVDKDSFIEPTDLPPMRHALAITVSLAVGPNSASTGGVSFSALIEKGAVLHDWTPELRLQAIDDAVALGLVTIHVCMPSAPFYTTYIKLAPGPRRAVCHDAD